MKLTVAIPTYGRDGVLAASIADLLALDPPPWELLIVDQTPRHDVDTEERLSRWHEEGRIRWLRLERPSITGAMNRALLEARGDRILFLDDDIRPDPDLLRAHQRAGELKPEVMVAGRVLQPWHGEREDPAGAPFLFNSLQPRRVEAFMGGNVAIPLPRARALGGFDTNFVKVAYHFEAEFAHRWCEDGGRIDYEPSALIHHLRAERGGTRSYGKHLTTLQPDHAVGRYYFLLRTRPALQALVGSVLAVFQSVRTRHHLRHPWWIPATLLAEGRGLIWALRLNGRGPALLSTRTPRLLVVDSQPDRNDGDLFRRLASESSLASDVLVLFMSPADLANPLGKLGWGPARLRPDAILITGWHRPALLQVHLQAQLLRIPVILRMASVPARPRSWLRDRLDRLLLRGVAVALPVDQAQARWYLGHGLRNDQLIASPRWLDSASIATRAREQRQQREALRQRWAIPQQSFCVLVVGSFSETSRSLDALEAMRILQEQAFTPSGSIHLLIVGGRDLEATCRDQAQADRLPVSFAAGLNPSGMASAYAASDCLVLLSDHDEPSKLVATEAMACGLPVVVSDQVGCRADLILEGKTGFSYPGGDAKALASCLAKMAGDRETSRRMGEAGKELVERSFTLESAAASIRAGVMRVIGRQHSRPSP